MHSNPARQSGASKIVNLILLAAIGYGIFVGIQYAPQYIESRSVQSILDNMVRTQHSDPVNNISSVRDKVVRMLQINDMNDMTGNFEVTGSRDSYTITFRYDRELNLGYEVRTIHYNQSVTL